MSYYHLQRMSHNYGDREHIAIVREQSTEQETLDLIEKALSCYFSKFVSVDFDDLCLRTMEMQEWAMFNVLTREGPRKVEISIATMYQ